MRALGRAAGKHSCSRSLVFALLGAFAAFLSPQSSRALANERPDAVPLEHHASAAQPDGVLEGANGSDADSYSNYGLLAGFRGRKLAMSSDEEDFDDIGYDKIYGKVEIYDPLESLNRKIFAFNNVIDENIIRPAAVKYNTLPGCVKTRISDFLETYTTPISFVNGALQLDFKSSIISSWRMLINLTVGLFGTFDVAAQMGLPPQRRSLGQTLGKYGVKTGPFLILPIVNTPTTLRDVSDLFFSAVFNPYRFTLGSQSAINQMPFRATRVTALGLSTRAEFIAILDNAKKNSADYYLAFRDSYLANSNFRIKQAKDNKGHFENYVRTNYTTQRVTAIESLWDFTELDDVNATSATTRNVDGGVDGSVGDSI